MNREELERQMNHCGSTREPFIFGIDFEMAEAFLYTSPKECREVLFDFNGYSNCAKEIRATPTITPEPMSFEEYQKRFDICHSGLRRGDSFLLNLTVPTPIHSNSTLEDIFHASKARYRVHLPRRFTCFSPESFVIIEDGTIRSFPMKGTIDSSVEDAANKILSDYKEECEHSTIVDLIRNDLNRVGRATRVERFRYIDELHTSRGSILQVSSEVCSELGDNYLSRLGTTILELLPAGSVSGAPKDSTLSIIAEAEGQRRGFYCGIAGYFDGSRFESCVLIRYIEEHNGALRYRSGGGVTINSDAKSEYKEIIDKIYIPR